MQGENVEGGGGEPIGESAPGYEEMTPEQQAVHDEVTRRDAAEISDEVKKQKEILDFAQQRGLNVENVRKEMELVGEAEAYEDYELDKVGKAAAESAIAVMIQGRSQHLEVEAPIGYSYSSRLKEDSVERMIKFLQAQIAGSITKAPDGVDKSKGDVVSDILKTPAGEFIYFRRTSGSREDLKIEYFVKVVVPK